MAHPVYFNYSVGKDMTRQFSETMRRSTWPFIACSHLSKTLNRNETDKLIPECIHELAAVEFDTIAFCGMSGSLVAPVLGHLMHKELIMVRKPEIKCISNLMVEGFAHAQRYVIVDDLITSGRTVVRTIRGVTTFAPQAELVGILTYYGMRLRLPDTREFQRIVDWVQDKMYYPCRADEGACRNRNSKSLRFL